MGNIYILRDNIQILAMSPNGALDYESRDSRFDPVHGHYILDLEGRVVFLASFVISVFARLFRQVSTFRGVGYVGGYYYE